MEAIMDSKKIVILIIIALVPIMGISAAEIKDIRSYSDNNKTRITVELDDNVQYQTQFDSEKNIIIYLLNTKIGSVNRLTKINDKLVKTVTLKENEDNVCVKTTLIKSATFIIFSLISPFRIVIDIIPTEKFDISGPISVALNNNKIIAEPKPKEPNIIAQIDKHENQSIEKENTTEPKARINENDLESLSQETVCIPFLVDFLSLRLKSQNIMFIQLALDIVFAIALLLTGISFIKFKHKYEGQKNVNLIKKKHFFTDILDEVGNHQEEKSIEKSENTNNKKINNDEKNKEINGNISLPKEYEKVYELSQRGMDRISISQKSNIPIGEVNLILDLMKSRKESNIV